MDRTKSKRTEPKIYFIVLNYCSYEDTIQCVKTIKNINYQNYKLLIIDNNSPDGSGKRLSQQIPKEEFIQLPKNTGYAGGNNYAIKMAMKSETDYVFIVNPDIRFMPDSITGYINIMEKNPKIGALNPVQICALDGPVDKRFKNSVLSFITEKEINNNIGKNILLEANTLFGASLLVSNHAIKKTGGFDPLYFAYGEEEDLCRRLKYHGFTLAVTFQFPVIHLRAYEDDGKKPDLFREYLRFRAGYIFELKDLNRSFNSNIKFFYYKLRGDLYNSKINKALLIKIWFYLKLLIWLSINLLKIKSNIHSDKIGFSHIDS